MEPNYLKIFNKQIMQAVSAYCKLNNVEDVDGFIKKCFNTGFNIEKYGLLGKTLNDGEKHLKTDGVQEKWVEKEVVVEKRVEVPVEVIKEVEKIVTKIEYISDKTTENELGEKIAKLMDEMSKKDEQLEEFRRNLDELLDKPPVEIIKEVLVQDTRALDELLLERSILKNKITELENTTKDNSKQKALEETIQKLRSELQLKNKEITDLKTAISEIQASQGRQGIFLDGSNLNRTINRK